MASGCGCCAREVSRVDPSSPTSDCAIRRLPAWPRCGISWAGVILRDAGVPPVLPSGVKCGNAPFCAAPQQQAAGTARLESLLIKL